MQDSGTCGTANKFVKLNNVAHDLVLLMLRLCYACGCGESVVAGYDSISMIPNSPAIGGILLYIKSIYSSSNFLNIFLRIHSSISTTHDGIERT